MLYRPAAVSQTKRTNYSLPGAGYAILGSPIAASLAMIRAFAILEITQSIQPVGLLKCESLGDI